MYIKKNVYDYIINNVTRLNSESGGILGADSHGVVCAVMLDNGIEDKDIPHCCYYPNIDLLNNCIFEWSVKEIIFAGLFHTHFSDKGSFSDDDLKYINEIMNSLPSEIDHLFFPLLLLPHKEFISYKAIKRINNTEVIDDSINIV